MQRPTTTLRDIAHFLVAADPGISRPLSSHGFRAVYRDPETGLHEARAPVVGVTRASKEHADVLLYGGDRRGTDDRETDVRTLLRDMEKRHAPRRRSSEDASLCTLEDLHLDVGDVLEVAVDMIPSRTDFDERSMRRARR